jgi:hypothetical protein
MTVRPLGASAAACSGSCVRFIYSSLQLTDIQEKPRRFTLVWCFQKADNVIPDVVWLKSSTITSKPPRLVLNSI